MEADGLSTQEALTQEWTRHVADMDNAAYDRATATVSAINAIMDDMGRPFGHRMGQAILYYVANYPSQPGRTDEPDLIDNALADQIELRLLPRLRGVVVDENRNSLYELAGRARSLGDEVLGNAIENAVQRSHETGLFVWRGFTRE